MELKKQIKFLCGVMFLIILVNPAFAQNSPGDMIRIHTVDGNTFMGELIMENEEQIVVLVDGVGEITIERAKIRRIERIDEDKIRDGVYWYDNPQGTRYFFAPNALSLRKGTWYYQNVWIFFNNVNYGLTDNFSIGGGMVPVFLFGGGNTPIWILPKFSIPLANDQFHIGVGAMIGGIIGSGSGDGFTLAYGNATVGNEDKNLTFGLGYGYAGSDWSTTPLVNISGLYRASRNIYLLTENYFVPGIDGSGVGIFGLRYAPESFAVDFGLAIPFDSGVGFIGIPWLGITIPFGR